MGTSTRPGLRDLLSQSIGDYQSITVSTTGNTAVQDAIRALASDGGVPISAWKG